RTAAGIRAFASHPIRSSKWCAFIVQLEEPRAQSRYRNDDGRECLDPAAVDAVYAANDCRSAARRTDSAPAVRSCGTGARAAVHPGFRGTEPEPATEHLHREAAKRIA